MPSSSPSQTGSVTAAAVLRRLGGFVAADRSAILMVVGLAVGLGILTLATPVAVQALVNFVAFGGLMQPLVVVGLLLLFFLAFSGAIRVFKAYVVELLQRRVFFRTARGLASRLPKVRLDAHDSGFGPAQVNRFFDVLTVQKAGSSLLIDGLDIVLQSVIGLIVLGFYHPFLLAFDVALVAMIAFVLFGLGRGAFRSARQESQSKYEVAAALEEIARAPVTYKLDGAVELAESRVGELTDQYLAARRRHYGYVLRQLIGAVSLQAIAATALLTLGGFLVIRGQLTLGQLVAAELIVSLALASFVKFGKQLEAFYDLLAGVDKLGTLFDLPVDEDRGEPHAGGDAGALLTMDGVSYAYPGREPVLRRISLRVDAGERVAVEGTRGSGKSTVAELLAGLRVPSTGLVAFDGVDLREIDTASLRPQLNLVSGFEIVDGTILENMRLGRDEIPVDQVREALDRFGILEELSALPEGLHTPVATTGAPLSRATGLLLSLARASLERPRAILVDGVLDELGGDSLALAVRGLRDVSRATIVVFTAREDVARVLDRRVTWAAAAPVLAGAEEVSA